MMLKIGSKIVPCTFILHTREDIILDPRQSSRKTPHQLLTDYRRLREKERKRIADQERAKYIVHDLDSNAEHTSFLPRVSLNLILGAVRAIHSHSGVRHADSWLKIPILYLFWKSYNYFKRTNSANTNLAMNFVNQLEDYLRDLGAEARKNHPGASLMSAKFSTLSWSTIMLTSTITHSLTFDRVSFLVIFKNLFA